ncbi:hypothetical protein AJ80_04576 [Polytolypa hystricis UAMH7299]|uniref:L-serine ammonia-lyase n=1 Tax=Polytolypa hystricis (strain UAMH7299) TaxID=1447883 RepID=A0A2B7YAR5_POLH7|nr:hypothetical protein AJ80_04576 [Polytolypa hystricis UAMH7299]
MGSFEEAAGPHRNWKPWIETPIIESAALSRDVGCRVFLKLENLQPSGSFKSRAIGNLVLSHISNPSNHGKNLHFFLPSGGNAGLAASKAAKSLGYQCTVVAPRTLNPSMADRLRGAGATVITHGETIAEAARYMREVLMEELKVESGTQNTVDNDTGSSNDTDTVAIELHPFDHERIWEGGSTLVDELAHQLPPPDIDDEFEMRNFSDKPLPVDGIICSVGGGGLMNGIIQGVERHVKIHNRGKSQRRPPPSVVNGGPDNDNNNNIHIIATETYGAESLSLSIAQRSLIKLPAITSQASSLGVVTIAQRTLENALTPPAGVEVHSLVLHDSQAARGVLRLLDDEKLLVELACGVSVEAAVVKDVDVSMNGCMGKKGNGAADTPPLTSRLARIIPNFGPKSRVVIVVCGGGNVTLPMLMEWKQRLENGWGSAEVCS